MCLPRGKKQLEAAQSGFEFLSLQQVPLGQKVEQ